MLLRAPKMFYGPTERFTAPRNASRAHETLYGPKMELFIPCALRLRAHETLDGSTKRFTGPRNALRAYETFYGTTKRFTGLRNVLRAYETFCGPAAGCASLGLNMHPP